MGIRVQPRKLEISDDDPFKNDLLGRKESAEVLTNLLGNMEGPCVLAVDSAWGTGKTTFLDMWRRHLRNEGFTVVHLNAWETDFTGDPFLAISSEITDQLYQLGDKPLKIKVARAREAAAEVAKRAIPAVIRLGTAGLLDLSPVFEKELGQALASFAIDRLGKYNEAMGSLAKFKNSFQEMGTTLSAASEGRPLVVQIDELDRCRPNYAIELLEVAKHLFSVDHVVFVLAINKEQLAHSIKAVYGSDFDSVAYLDRFFDIDFRLPELSRVQFVEATIDLLRINEYFERTEDIADKREYERVRRLLKAFLSNTELTLRRIEQSLHRLGLLLASLRNEAQPFALASTLATLLRTIDFDLYHQFTEGQITDLELANGISSFIEIGQVQNDDAASIFKALLILAWAELNSTSLTKWKIEESPLWLYYDKQHMIQNQPNFPASDRDYSIDTLRQHVDNLFYHSSRSSSSRQRAFGFRVAVERLELFSDDLT